MTTPRVMEAVVDKAEGAADYRAASIDQARQHAQHLSNSKLVLVAAAMHTKVSIPAPQLTRTAGYVGKNVTFGRYQYRALSDG